MEFYNVQKLWPTWIYARSARLVQGQGIPSTLFCSVVSNSFRPHGLCPARLLCPWNSPGKNNEVGSHSLLQGTFWPKDQTLLPHHRLILYLWATREAPLYRREGLKSALRQKTCKSKLLLKSPLGWPLGGDPNQLWAGPNWVVFPHCRSTMVE